MVIVDKKCPSDQDEQRLESAKLKENHFNSVNTPEAQAEKPSDF